MDLTCPKCRSANLTLKREQKVFEHTDDGRPQRDQPLKVEMLFSCDDCHVMFGIVDLLSDDSDL